MKNQFFKEHPELNEAWEALGIVTATEEEIKKVLAGVHGVEAKKVYREMAVPEPPGKVEPTVEPAAEVEPTVAKGKSKSKNK